MPGYQFSRELATKNVPAELRERAQWVAWTLVQDPPKAPGEAPPKPRKVPIDPKTGKYADPTDRSTWSTFDLACGAVETEGAVGIGYVFAADDPYCGFDFDHALIPQTITNDDGRIEIETHHVDAGVAEPVKLLSSHGYAEKSQSGDGLHVIVRGKPPTAEGRRNGRVEVYSQDRYFAVTGDAWGRAPATLPESNGAIPKAWGMLGLDAEGDDAGGTTGPYAGDVRATPLSIDDAIAKARLAKNGAGERFAALFDRGDLGAHGGDHSAADMALVGMLAFWLGIDPERIDEAFRRSKLYRGKWERPEYRDSTIGKVLRARLAEGAGVYGDKRDEATAADDGERFGSHTAQEVKRLPPPTFLVEGYIVKDTIVTAFGPAEAAKSLFAKHLSHCLGLGLDVFGRKVEQGPAFYIAAEGAGGIRNRIMAWETHHGQEDKVETRFMFQVVNMRDDKEVDAFIAYLQTLPEPPALLVVDTLAWAMAGGKENDVDVLMGVYSNARRIREAVGCVVFIIHHTGKDGQIERGSSSIRHASDTMIKMVPDPKKKGTIVLTVDKQKDGAEKPPPLRLAVRSVAVAVPEGTGGDALLDMRTAPVLVLADPEKKAEPGGTAEGGQADWRDVLSEKERAVLTVLRRINDTEGAASTSRWLTQSVGPKLRDRGFYDIKTVLEERGYVASKRKGNGNRTVNHVTLEGRAALDTNPFTPPGGTEGATDEDA